MKIAIIGAGRIGLAVYKFLPLIGITGDNVAIFDINHHLDYSPARFLSSEEQLKEYDIWVVATPFTENRKYIDAADRLGKVYMDFSEDVESMALAKFRAGRVAWPQTVGPKFIPACGLAPGWVSIIANALAKKFYILKEIVIMVGALPKSAMNGGKYALTWSAEGLVNEYLKEATIRLEGETTKVPSLGGLQSIIINGKEYEAFYTSGGIGTLIDTWTDQYHLGTNGKSPESIVYKTIRYPGHCDLISYLMEGKTHDEIVEKVKEHIPTTRQDTVIVYIEVLGIIDGVLTTKNFVHEFRHTRDSTAIEITTAMGMLVWLDYLNQRGIENQKAFTKQEDMPFDFFNQSFRSLYTRIYGETLDSELVPQ